LWFSGMWWHALGQVRTYISEKSVVFIFSIDWCASCCRWPGYSTRPVRNYYLRRLARRMGFLPYTLSNLADSLTIFSCNSLPQYSVKKVEISPEGKI
jgi:hypothetical protein